MKETELRPCPACGIIPHIEYCCGEYMVFGDFPECPCCGGFTEMHSNKQTEIDAWNRRATYEAE